METLKLVRLDWLSQERDKYVWEDRSWSPWNEIMQQDIVHKWQVMFGAKEDEEEDNDEGDMVPL